MYHRFITGTALIFFGVCPLKADSLSATQPAKTSEAYELKTPYHTEQEWIVASVCLNAYEMLSYIADKKGEIVSPDQVSVKKIDGDAVAYRVTLHGGKVTVEAMLNWPGSIWSSQAYVPFCQAAMTQLKLPRGPAGQETKGTPLATLLDFSEKSIEVENRRVSQWLTDEPDNSLAQQQAALILGTLALKENSGWFWDPRDICNHGIAHLAVARSLDPGAPLSTEGQVAECLVGLIDDNKKECADEIAQLGKLDAAPKELAAWIRATGMRNSRDWRLLDQPEKSSGLEQVEYFRALSEAVNPDQAIAWLRDKSIPNRPDWNRLVLEFSFSVEAGHGFALPSVSSEIATMRATFPDRYQTKTLISDLNEAPDGVLTGPPSSPRRLCVVSGGMWAQFFQRHLCHAIVETGDFLQSKWGVPDQAEQFDGQINGFFSGLNLFPYVQEVNALLRQNPDDPKAIVESFTQHPEWAQDFVNRMPPTTAVDHAKFHAMVRNWFSPPILSGTAYAAVTRVENIGATLKSQPGAIDKLYAIAPLQFGVAQLELTARYSEHPAYTHVLEIMGPMVDYYLNALDRAANASDVKLDSRISLEEKAAGMDPERFWNLATDLRQNGRDSDAADAFQQYFDKGTDRVAVSNEMEWLVNYYYDHGQKDKAMAIAQACAEIYSYRGLETMMNLLVRLGQLDQAETYGEKIKERYNDPGPLNAFYLRQGGGGGGQDKAKLVDAIKTIFPAGLKKVSLDSFTIAPTSGIQFEGTSSDLAANGLSHSQVVVALDGYQIQNIAQYSVVRSFSISSSMTFIVWDGQAYREIKADQPGRRFGVEMTNYKH